MLRSYAATASSRMLLGCFSIICSFANDLYWRDFGIASLEHHRMHYDLADRTRPICLHFDDDWNHSQVTLEYATFSVSPWRLTCAMHPDLHLIVQASNDSVIRVVASLAYDILAFSSFDCAGSKYAAESLGHLDGWRISESRSACLCISLLLNYSKVRQLGFGFCCIAPS